MNKKQIYIFEIPLYYIAFTKNKQLENNLYDVGFKNINHSKAVNGKQFTPEYLITNKIITLRAYNDLKIGRQEHAGLSSLGAVGCTMSHNKLWNLCIKNNYPFIIIVEDDCYIPPLKIDNIKKIQNILDKPKSIFISSSNIVKKKITTFFFTHFYICSLESCKELVNNCFPIDVQTDSYIAHLDTLKKINIEGFEVSKQTIHPSSIQDICIKCLLPNDKSTYINIIFSIIIILILISIILIILIKSNKSCIKKCL